MKQICSALALVTFLIVLSNCISMRLIQKIEFINSSGSMVNITCEKFENAISVINGKSIIIDISNTEFVRMSYSDSNQFYQYDLSGLDIKAATDEEKSGKTFSGAVCWVYICTINSDKTLSFKSRNRDDGSKSIILSPMNSN